MTPIGRDAAEIIDGSYDYEVAEDIDKLEVFDFS